MASEVVFVTQARGRIVQPHPQKACVAIKSPLWALLEWITALRIVFARERIHARPSASEVRFKIEQRRMFSDSHLLSPPI